MKITASRLATMALLLGLAVVIAGCANPQESADPDVDSGDAGTQTNETSDAVQPTLPAFDPDAGGEGNETVLP
jgi:PBP1b-binding outer membrane lipoprotein LpoB